MPRKKQSRLYYREGRGWYADNRDYADVGGRREAMTPKGGRFATKGQDEAMQLLATRLQELEAARAAKAEGLAGDPRLSDYARRHLEIKKKVSKASTVRRIEIALRRLVGFYGDPRLSEIEPHDVTNFIVWRLAQPGTRGKRVQPATVRKELGALANLYDRAVREQQATKNPVLSVPREDWPRAEYREPTYLEPGEVARIFELARRTVQSREGRCFPFTEEMLAAFALTGGRKAEVFGLERRDVDLEHRIVHIRPNRWRGLKAPRHTRWMPLWPQLEAYLRPLLEQEGSPYELLFPGRKGLIRNLDYTLPKLAERAGVRKRVTLHTFRHTYAATRIQTLDHGQPVHLFTVARELGHTNVQLLEKLYGHLIHTRYRSAVVAYREASVIPLQAHGLRGA